MHRSRARQQQDRFDSFLHEFNEERPHEVLDMKRPAEVYTASTRRYDGLPELTYPFHDRDVASWLAKSSASRKDDGIWLTSFMHHDLGYFDLEQKTLQPLDNPFGTRLSPAS
jgi:hypothetical protein